MSGPVVSRNLSQNMPNMNPWEYDALHYNYEEDVETTAAAATTVALAAATTLAAGAGKNDAHDPTGIIYPGLYAPSGFDMMSILMSVISRPSPVIDLGPIDASCALIMCDLYQPDCPVVYANDAFEHLTGYSPREIIGRNCRFLQAPGGKVRRSSRRQHVTSDLVGQMRAAVENNSELALEVTNFKKNGQPFINLLAMIPVFWQSSTPRYSVGFQAEKTW